MSPGVAHVSKTFAGSLTLFHKQLPHHEHLLPEIPSESLKDRLYKDIKEADGQPKTIQAEVKLEQAKRDETNIRMAVHASLPACLDQVNLLPTYQHVIEC